MIAWLSVQSAFAEAPEGVSTEAPASENQLDALEARLLGELPVEIETVDSYESTDMIGAFWVLPLFLFMIGIVLWSRFRKTTPLNPGEIRIDSRTPLGKEGSLAIIEVGDAEGGSQKMLIGLSEQGAPRLLSVLSADWRPETPSVSNNSMANISDFDQFLDRVSPVQSTVDPELEDRNDLVEELLNARGVEQYQRNAIAESSTVSPEFPTATFETDEEDEDDPWVVNFRRKYQSQS